MLKSQASPLQNFQYYVVVVFLYILLEKVTNDLALLKGLQGNISNVQPLKSVDARTRREG